MRMPPQSEPSIVGVRQDVVQRNRGVFGRFAHDIVVDHPHERKAEQGIHDQLQFIEGQVRQPDGQSGDQREGMDDLAPGGQYDGRLKT